VLAVALGLASSLCWGISDFVGGLKSRSLELLSVLLLSQLTGVVLVALLVVLRGRPPPPAGDLALGALSGVSGVLGLAAFYRGLATGAMAVVAPIAASGAVIPVAAGLLEGERPSATQAAGVALAIAGVATVSRETGEAGRPARLAAGVGLALAAAVGIGGFFVALDHASGRDLPWALLAARAASVGGLGLAVIALRPRLAVARADAVALALVGALDVTANGLFAAAANEGLVSLAAVLSSLYPVVTIVLARLVLAERVRRSQGGGIAAVLVGVALISAG